MITTDWTAAQALVGKLGDRRTGYQMMHYIEQGGLFDQACHDLLSQGFTMTWGFAQQQLIHRKDTPTEQNNHLKTKYGCAACGLNAWAKPNVKLACVTCSTLMQEIKR